MNAIQHTMSDRGDEPLRKLFQTGRLQNYIKGETILHGDEETESVYCIANGYVKVYSINEQGEEYVHIIYGPGEIFPLVWAIANIHRRVFYESMGASELWRLPTRTLMERANTDAAVASALLRQVTVQFGVYADRLDNLEYKYARERLVYRLLFLASRFGEKRGRSIVIAAPITQQTLGDTINLSRETVGRELDRLVRKGYVGLENHRFVIKDPDALSRELPGPISPDYWGLKDN